MSLPTTTSITTFSDYETYCIIVKTLPLPGPSTATSITDDGLYRYITYEIAESQEPTCHNWYSCFGQVQSNPDIAGIGVIIAFLVTAWAAFLFLVLTYGTGRMSPSYIRRVESICFRVNSTNVAMSGGRQSKKLS